MFCNAIRCEHAAPVRIRVHHAAAADDAAGVEHAVAAQLRVIANERAELTQARVDFFITELHGHIAGERFEIGQHHTRAKVRVMA